MIEWKQMTMQEAENKMEVLREIFDVVRLLKGSDLQTSGMENKLEGDHYFKIHRENHNLDRCRTQFKLVEDMENKWEIMQKITEKYRRMYKQEKSDYFGY